MRDIIKRELLSDNNCYSAAEIQNMVENGDISWYDLRDIFTDDKIDAIMKWTKAELLPPVPDIPKTPKGSTVAYFWGGAGSGKTCLIGSLIGCLCNVKNNFIPIKSESKSEELYRYLLANLFSGNNVICKLPDSTITTNLPALNFGMRDEKKRQHQLMLIEVACGAFTAIFKKRNGQSLDEHEEKALNKIESFLIDKQDNPTIHFFVVEYGAAEKEVDPNLLPGVKQIDVLQSVAAYFKEKKVFQKSTVGVYVVVTKCDKIDCLREERDKKVDEYISNGVMGDFIDNLKEYIHKAHIADFKKFSFSIGDVFAQDLCVLDVQDTVKIIEKLLAETHWVGDRWWERFLCWLIYKKRG